MNFKSTLLTGIMLCSLATSGAATAQAVQGFDNGGSAIRSYNGFGVPLMRSFYFRYQDGDHHIRAIKVSPNEPQLGRIWLNFSDQNGDDDYFYNIHHHRYTGRHLSRKTGQYVCVGSCTRTITRPANPSDWVFVIQGFDIYYHGDDNHIDQLRVSESNGRVSVALNDRKNDDTFLWQLQYSYVPRTLFRSISRRLGTARGSTRVRIPSGVSLIRGFNFNFQSGDRHLRELGVFMPGNGNLDVFYEDDSGNDSYFWQIDYGILR